MNNCCRCNKYVRYKSEGGKPLWTNWAVNDVSVLETVCLSSTKKRTVNALKNVLEHKFSVR